MGCCYRSRFGDCTSMCLCMSIAESRLSRPRSFLALVADHLARRRHHLQSRLARQGKRSRSRASTKAKISARRRRQRRRRPCSVSTGAQGAGGAGGQLVRIEPSVASWHEMGDLQASAMALWWRHNKRRTPPQGAQRRSIPPGSPPSPSRPPRRDRTREHKQTLHRQSCRS